LASAGIILGSFLAWGCGFSWLKFGLLLGTALMLQILSNLANDYGDFVKGTDNKDRTGEKRMVASGAISPSAMLRAIIICAILTFGLGTWLLLSIELTPGVLVFFFGIGILSIIAAITYTVGKKAYGYSGFGDLAVFVFFGWVSVAGSNFLMRGSGYFDLLTFLPASAIGLLAAGVLNLNNLRDHINDKASGKNTLVVKMGFEKAKRYHTFLLSTPFLLGFVFVAFYYHTPWQCAFLATGPVFFKLGKAVNACNNPSELDGELKKQALTTLLFAILFAAGNMM